ncbi:MAG: WXG100 family type VII secretion target [Pseudonocardiaceae bacterium]
MPPDGGPLLPVKVEPEDFHNVATSIANGSGHLQDTSGWLEGMTTAAAGIAGVDDGAKQFDPGYQDALNTLFQAFDRAIDVLNDVAAGIDQSAANHWNADAAANPGGGAPPPWDVGQLHVSYINLPRRVPQATSLVGNPVMPLPSPLDEKIPLGHQTLLHDLADRFNDAANTVDGLRTDLYNHLKELFSNNSSDDLDALNTFWNTIGGDSDSAILTAVRDGCRQLSQAVTDFADWIADTQN